MKNVIILLCAAGLCISCIGQPQQQRQRPVDDRFKDMVYLAPEKLCGNLMAVINVEKEGNCTLIMNEDETFIYTIGETVCNGTWKYDASSRILRYRMDWMEGEKQMGYLMDFIMLNDQTIIWLGYWYLTNAQMRLNKQFKFADQFVDNDEEPRR